MPTHPRRSRLAAIALAALAGLAAAPGTLAGGTPENILLIIDPSHPDALYIGNYYKFRRQIPDRNVLYLDPDAPGWTQFIEAQLPGFLGHLDQRAIADHIDYVVVAPGPSFYIDAPGLVNDSCWPVARFSLSSVFTMAFLTDDILAGPNSTTTNHYSSTDLDAPSFFDSGASWRFGVRSGDPAARRYFIGAMLGYTGQRGNTLVEILDLIDGAIAADGTRPAGTFYFMNNTADPARNVRAMQYGSIVNDIVSRGGAAEVINGVLPADRHDALGIMTGAATLDFAGASLTITPGAFADHLTSYAATFDTGAQTKVSAWIARGAAGSAGAVEEPCNYPGKFPGARFHSFYFQGMSLGEAYLRSMSFVPFQSLLYGDPMARPFAHLPDVDVPDAPAGPVAGTIFLHGEGTTTHPIGEVTIFELLIDGVSQGVDHFGAGFFVDTTTLDDGWHDLRMIGYDNTITRSAGRWIGTLVVDNHGRSAAVESSHTSGNLSTPFRFTVTGSGAPVAESRLIHNGRVIAAATGSPASFTVFGANLGAATSRLHGEVLYTDGRRARSAPVQVSVANNTPPTGVETPVAFSYTHVLARPDRPAVIELPAAFDATPGQATYTVVSGPAQATLADTGAGPFRVLIPGPDPCGADTLTFRVQTSGGTSNLATVTIRYGPPPVGCRADFNGDGDLTPADFSAFRQAFLAGDQRADFNDDCTLSPADFSAFRSAFLAGCP